MLGCTGAASVAAFWVLLRDNGLILETSQRPGSDPGDTGAWFAAATPASFARATAAPEAPLPLQNVPTATSFPLPEPTLTSAPTPTATPVVEDVLAAADTPTALPTQPPPATLPTETVPPPTETQAPARAQIQHVVIISIDGLRPDALELADAPVLDGLKMRGAYSPNAKAVVPSHTMANHASMLGGMVPDKHGVFWDILYAEAPRVKGPTLFNVAHDAGLSTMMVVGKPKLEYLVLPNSVDKFIGQDFSDTDVKNQAIGLIKAGLPNVLFIHFPDVDRTGHDLGWMSPGQLQAVALADSSIGEVLAALEGGGYLSSTLLIVTSDHGGHDGTHGSDMPEDTTIFWLAVGPGVPAGVTLSSSINTYDTAATALYALNLPIPAEWDGKPILEIFN